MCRATGPPARVAPSAREYAPLVFEVAEVRGGQPATHLLQELSNVVGFTLHVEAGVQHADVPIDGDTERVSIMQREMLQEVWPTVRRQRLVRQPSSEPQAGAHPALPRHPVDRNAIHFRRTQLPAHISPNPQ